MASEPTDEGATMSTYWVVIDVGCHECGVSSEGVGIFPTEAEAKAAAEQRDEATGQWRDGGQTFCEIFKMQVP